MPLFLINFIGWIGSAVASAIAFFATRKGIKFAAMVALIALVGTAITALVSEVDTLIGSVVPTSLGFATAFVPDNLGACVSAIIATEVACTTYALAIRFINWKSKVLLS
jgi:hypothetical protein